MLQNGERITLTQDLLDAIAAYMHDDLREELHFRFAPCEPDFFLREYIKRDPKFAIFLKEEFRIEME